MLYVSNNRLSSSVPEWISSLTKLQELYMHHNSFTSSLPELTLPELQFLSLSHNQITGSLPALVSRSLLVVDLQANRLTSSLAPMAQWGGVKVVYLNDNLLTGTVPDSVGLLRLEVRER